MPSDLAAVAALLRCVAEVADPSGALERKNIDLRVQPALRRRFNDPTTRTELFSGMPHTTGAGVAAYLSARRSDGRLVVWTVEAWLDTWDRDAGSPWIAVVKGEIEVDVPSGDPDTVFDVQRNVHDVPARSPPSVSARRSSPPTTSPEGPTGRRMSRMSHSREGAVRLGFGR